MSQKVRTELNATSGSTFPTNLNKQIKAIDHRTYNTDIIDSHFNLLEDDLSSINLSTGENAETVLNTAVNNASRIAVVGGVNIYGVFGDVTNVNTSGFSIELEFNDIGTNKYSVSVVSNNISSTSDFFVGIKNTNSVVLSSNLAFTSPFYDIIIMTY